MDRLFVLCFLLTGFSLTYGETLLYGRNDDRLSRICGDPSTSSYIVNGEPAEIERHPWHAVIRQEDSNLLCGGVLIDSKHVLTAAHCFVNAVRTYYVTLGQAQLDGHEDQVAVFGASFSYIHPWFHNGTIEKFNGDIAVIELDIPVTFSSHIKPICMPDARIATKIFRSIKDATVIGFGLTEDSHFAGSLQEANVTLLNSSNCRQWWRKVRDDEICGWGGSTGVCRGDSGGSMVVVDHNKHYVIGLTSWGHADCKTDVPDVFVNIPTHVNWIKSITLKKEVKLDTLSDQCAYSAQILPRPRILLLGATGVGKSTLGNQLLGYYARSEEVPFVVGDSLTSQTSRISYKIGPWLGKGECFTVIDTPGTHDSEGRDYEHAVHMADIMKNEIGSVDVILILLSGQNLRFDQSVLELLKLYESIYSKNMWKHVMLETTFWSHDIRSVRSRKNRQNMNEEKRHISVNQKLKQTFNLTFDVPTVFIDPVLPIFGDDYDQSIMEENEVEAFDEYTRQLWDFAMNKEPFHCAGNCQAPQGYFGGQPWVTPNKVAQREGKSTELTCRIWSGINQHAFNNITWTFNGNVVYVKKGNGDGSSVLFDPELNVTDTGADTHGNFAMSKLIIPTFSSKREGTYSCNNGLENDETNKAEVLLVVDAQWSEWGAWSSCSVHCMDEGSANPGSAHRTRTCTPPRNGGIKCREEDGRETTQCAGVVGQPLKFCPVDHRFTAWTSWGGCETGGCNDWRGKRKGHKYRHRVCVEARHGGVPCPKDPGATKQSARCSEDCGWRKWF